MVSFLDLIQIVLRMEKILIEDLMFYKRFNN